jgi:hypothetical protein
VRRVCHLQWQQQAGQASRHHRGQVRGRVPWNALPVHALCQSRKTKKKGRSSPTGKQGFGFREVVCHMAPGVARGVIAHHVCGAKLVPAATSTAGNQRHSVHCAAGSFARGPDQRQTNSGCLVPTTQCNTCLPLGSSNLRGWLTEGVPPARPASNMLPATWLAARSPLPILELHLDAWDASCVGSWPHHRAAKVFLQLSIASNMVPVVVCCRVRGMCVC